MSEYQGYRPKSEQEVSQEVVAASAAGIAGMELGLPVLATVAGAALGVRLLKDTLADLKKK